MRHYTIGLDLECKDYMGNYVSGHTESIRDGRENYEEIDNNKSYIKQ